jgi:hypothetical protein
MYVRTGSLGSPFSLTHSIDRMIAARVLARTDSPQAPATACHTCSCEECIWHTTVGSVLLAPGVVSTVRQKTKPLQTSVTPERRNACAYWSETPLLPLLLPLLLAMAVAAT